MLRYERTLRLKMKIFILFSLVLSSWLAKAAGRWISEERQAQVTAVIVDEESQVPLSQVRVRGLFCHEVPPSECVKNSGAPKFVHTKTGQDGMVTLVEDTNCGSVIVTVEMAPKGYYNPIESALVKFRENDGNIWLPDNVVVTVALQRVNHAVAVTRFK